MHMIFKLGLTLPKDLNKKIKVSPFEYAYTGLARKKLSLLKIHRTKSTSQTRMIQIPVKSGNI